MSGCKSDNVPQATSDNKPSVNTDADDRPVAVFSEALFSEQELVELSDLVAEVKVDKIKEKTIKTFEKDAPQDSMDSKTLRSTKLKRQLLFIALK